MRCPKHIKPLRQTAVTRVMIDNHLFIVWSLWGEDFKMFSSLCYLQYFVWEYKIKDFQQHHCSDTLAKQ